jgi:Holliday junction resolvase RusA-like endonuclease
VSITFLRSGGATIYLTIDGRPTGKGRPRLGKSGRVYTPKDTKLAETVVIDAWVNAGSPRCEDGPLRMEVELVVARPKGHYKRDGQLSAEGLRHPLPRRKPDVDNALKLVMDALNGRAYRDDVDIVDARVIRRWADQRFESTTVRVWPA